MAKIELHLPKSSHGSSGVNYNSLPKRYLDILVFGNDAWTIAIRDLPYLKVGPYHTNTVAGLQLQWIFCAQTKYQQTDFMITDGKPSCVRERWFVLYE
jgi:uncharacterized protein with von Willebrand factor type A (vWA) domain